MKKLIGFILLTVISIAWVTGTSWHFYDLNSIQNLTGYRYGILGVSGIGNPPKLELPAEGAGARILIDTLGIPHIFAGDDTTLAFATGYMHARDRYFQMELLAHIVMGRLSEMIGSSGVGSDKLWKTFELEERAKKLLDSLSVNRPDLYNYLSSYTKGINAWLDKEGVRRRDPLYLVWNYSPTPWKTYYTFFIQWYMSFDLTFFDDYVDRQELLDKLPDDVRNTLYPTSPDKHAFIIPQQESAPAVPHPDANSLVRLFQPSQQNCYAARPTNSSLGSNNWVIGAGHTKNGELILCNDLHLFLTSPNIFYELQLSSPGIHVYGYSIPGVPFVLTGHNERIAWGITSGGWDVTEQYLLKRDPANEKHYWVNGKWDTMEARKYRIRVKGHDDEEWTTDQTAFGPLVKKDSIAYALRWLPQYSASSVYTFWKMMKVGNWTDFREALRSYDYPSQNFVYADVEKNIGMVCAGKMPVKPKGYSGGMLDGTSMPEEKFIPFDSLPQCFDPARNYLFSANQEPEPGGYYYSSRWFDDLYRPQRIDQLLSSEKKFDTEDMRQMQLDVTDLSVRDLKALLNKYRPAEQSRENWTLLMKWDGQLKVDEKEAVFYKDFISATRITGNDLAVRLGVKATPHFDQFIHFLLTYDSIPFGKASIYTRDWFERLVNVTDSLYALNGNPATGRYIYSFNIPQMTFLPVFDKGVNDIGGSENTINVNYGAHPVIRTLIEIRDGKIYSSMVNAIGQTGRINEKNYYQQLSSWEKNDLHRTQFTSDPQQIKAVATTIIFLKNSK